MSIIKKIFSAIIPGYRQLQKLKWRVEALEGKNFGVFDFGKNNKFVLIKQNGTVVENPQIPGLTVVFHENNNLVELHEPLGEFRNCRWELRDNSKIIINSFSICIYNLMIPYGMHSSSLSIGKNFSCISAEIQMHDEAQCNVIIGNDCMFSCDIMIRPSDGHTIIDKVSNKICNRGGEIIIGNHVWVGMRSVILKNSYISEGCIIGACSLVNKKFLENNCIIAGIPGKIVKSNIYWDCRNPEVYLRENK